MFNLISSKKLPRTLVSIILILTFFNSCSGGGTLGSSSSGGVTIQGNAKTSLSGAPVANSEMTVFASDGKTELLQSETNKEGTFSMRIDNPEDDIKIQILKASSTFTVDKSLVDGDDLRLLVVDAKNNKTEIASYLSTSLKTTGSCSVESDKSNNVFIKTENYKDCIINVHTLLDSLTNEKDGVITLSNTCGLITSDTRNNINKKLDIEELNSNSECSNTKLTINFDNLEATFIILG
jgi:predicted DNA binding protein